MVVCPKLSTYKYMNIMINKIKIFFSYSIQEKRYLEELKNNIGQDYAIVDNYTLEDGENVMDEIKTAIENSSHFVFLMSESSLQSPWCNEELNFARELYDNDEIKMMSFVIDSTIDINNLGRKRWLKSFVMDHVYNPIQLSRQLKRKIRMEIWKQFPELEKKHKLIIGREREMGQIVSDYYAGDSIQKLAVVLSGIPHIGRRRILREFIHRIIASNTEAYDTIDVKLKDNDDLSDFVLQINDIIGKYTYEELLELIKEGKRSCLAKAIELLNDLSQRQEYIVIEDDNCIVKGNGMLTAWFMDIIKNAKLIPHMHLYVASRYTPTSSLRVTYPEILVYSVKALDRKGMKTLLNAYLEICSVSMQPKEIEELLDVVSVYPEHVIYAVEDAKKHIFPLALKNTKKRAELFDGNFVQLINEIKQDEKLYNVMLTLSVFEFISYDTLNELTGYDCVNEIEKLYHYSLLEFFGSNSQYVCLSPAFGSYLKRMKIRLSKTETKRIKERTKKILENMNDHLPDMSFRLYATMEAIRERNPKLNEKYLVPSFVLKVVTEEYYEGHDNNVIDLCDRVLYSINHNQYNEIMRSLHYWLCCSLCRKKDSRFLQEIQHFDSDSYSYFFLYGFYWRHNHNYEKAEQFYDEALQRKHTCEDVSYISKAQHEMVMVKTHLGHYTDALILAEDSYNHARTNTYHIESYFRCLVRSANPDKSILVRLIKEMKNSQDAHRDIIASTLEAEYKFYIERDFQASFKMIENLLKDTSDSYRNYPLRSLREMCKSLDNLSYYKSVKKKYSLKENFYFDEPS